MNSIQADHAKLPNCQPFTLISEVNFTEIENIENDAKLALAKLPFFVRF